MTDRPVALVTGSSRGIGRAVAIELAACGHDVVVNFRENATAAAETAAAVRKHGTVALLCQADVGDSTQRERLVHATLERFDRIDVLVNNAGIPVAERVDLLDASEASWDHVLSINLKGPYFLTQRVAREMIRFVETSRLEPKIINIGSVSAYAVSTDRGEYCVAKAGLWMMTQLFAARLAEHGIAVFEVRPGVIATDMTAPVRAKYDARFASGLTPIARWGEPREVARAVAALVRGHFPYCTGEVINIDGGFHVRRL